MSHGSILQNGSFESADFTGWTAIGNLSATTSPNGVFVASDGLYVVNLNDGDKAPNGILSQSFGADIGTTYLLEFNFAKGGESSGSASLDISVEGIGVLVDETLNDSAGGGPGPFSTYAFSFTADSTLLTLSFADNTGGLAIGFDAGLDNVSITAIPEPSGIALMGLVSGCILFFRRRFHS